MNEISFGQIITKTRSFDELLFLEHQTNKHSQFTQIDKLLLEVLNSALQEHLVVEWQSSKIQNKVSVPILHKSLYKNLRENNFSLNYQERKGAWYIPEITSLKAGRINFFHYMARYPVGAADLSKNVGGKISLSDNPDGFLIWSLLEPLFDFLLTPFDLRGTLAGTKSAEEKRRIWQQYEEIVNALELNLSEVLDVMHFGGTWNQLNDQQHLQIKTKLIRSLQKEVKCSTIKFYRAYRIKSLIDNYYTKVKKSNQKTMRKILIREHQRTLSGFFEGDWLAFLNYIEEVPDKNEEIITALPKSQILRPVSEERIKQVAETTGISLEEINRIKRAGEKSSTSKFSMEERTEVLTQFWREFENFHNQQTPGMASLWGLSERGYGGFGPWDVAGAKQAYISNEIDQKIKTLWGNNLLLKYPNRIVSSLNPYHRMSAAFGPSLRFWENCSLTAWYVCEGAASRTKIDGLAEYLQKEIFYLNKIDCPINTVMFDELNQIYNNFSNPEFVQYSLANGNEYGWSRYEGFTKLRNIITKHRNEWTDKYLKTYLEKRWKTELEETSRAFNRLTSERGKIPTLKQFVEHADRSTNNWLNGDISSLYKTIGEKSPVVPHKNILIPVEREHLIEKVYRTLLEHIKQNELAETTNQYSQYSPDNSAALRLALDSILYMQFIEIHNRNISLEEFGKKESFRIDTSNIWNDVENAWDIYGTIVRQLAEEQRELQKTSTYLNNLESQRFQYGKVKKPFWC